MGKDVVMKYDSTPIRSWSRQVGVCVSGLAWAGISSLGVGTDDLEVLCSRLHASNPMLSLLKGRAIADFLLGRRASSPHAEAGGFFIWESGLRFCCRLAFVVFSPPSWAARIHSFWLACLGRSRRPPGRLWHLWPWPRVLFPGWDASFGAWSFEVGNSSSRNPLSPFGVRDLWGLCLNPFWWASGRPFRVVGMAFH